MKKIISLDFWGTVAVFNPEYAKARTAYLAKLFGLPEDEAHARYQFVKRACDNEAENSGAAVTPLQAVKRLLKGTKVSKSALDVMLDIENLVREHPPIMTDDMKGTIFEMQHDHGFIVGVSSNTNFIRGRLIEEIHDLRWDFEVYSDEWGVSKPDPDFFNLVIRDASRVYMETRKPTEPVVPQDIIHIGDNSICDKRGAESAGMQGWLTKSPQETITYLNRVAGQAAA